MELRFHQIEKSSELFFIGAVELDEILVGLDDPFELLLHTDLLSFQARELDLGKAHELITDTDDSIDPHGLKELSLPVTTVDDNHPSLVRDRRRRLLGRVSRLRSPRIGCSFAGT